MLDTADVGLTSVLLSNMCQTWAEINFATNVVSYLNNTYPPCNQDRGRCLGDDLQVLWRRTGSGLFGGDDLWGLTVLTDPKVIVGSDTELVPGVGMQAVREKVG